MTLFFSFTVALHGNSPYVPILTFQQQKLAETKERMITFNGGSQENYFLKGSKIETTMIIILKDQISFQSGSSSKTCDEPETV